MVDRLLANRSAKRDVLSTPGYSPSNAVTSRRLLNPDARNLTVVIPPWHGGGWVYETYIKRLVRHGSAVITYGFNDEILKPDVVQTLDSFMQIQAVIASELHELVKSHGYEDVTLSASSLGNVGLALIAERFTGFNKATMLVAGCDAAKSVWEGIRTQDIRQSLEIQGYDEEQLVKLWQPLAPVAHAKAFSGKEIDFVISTRDEIVPTVYQQELADALKQAGAKVDVTYTRLGHYLAVGQSCLIGRL